jgi:hypothetical protein
MYFRIIQADDYIVGRSNVLQYPDMTKTSEVHVPDARYGYPSSESLIRVVSASGEVAVCRTR